MHNNFIVVISVLGSFYVQSPPLSKFTSKFEDLVNLNELIPVLYEAGVLVNEEVEKLIEAVWNNKLKVVYLITIMRGKGKEGLQRLIDCLEKEPNHLGHAELAGILKEGSHMREWLVSQYKVEEAWKQGICNMLEHQRCMLCGCVRCLGIDNCIIQYTDSHVTNMHVHMSMLPGTQHLKSIDLSVSNPNL